jgi:acetyl esterase/lipase
MHSLLLIADEKWCAAPPPSIRTNLAESPYDKPNVKPAKGEAGGVMPPFVRQFLYSCYVPVTQETPRSSPLISPINAPADAFPSSVTIITCEGDSLSREGHQMAHNIRNGRKSTTASSSSYPNEKPLGQETSNGVLLWEAKGQGHNWDKMCKTDSEAAKQRDFAYRLATERLKSALFAR